MGQTARTATVRALPLGERQAAIRVFGAHPDAPGVGDLVRSARLLKHAKTNRDLRAARDALAGGAVAMGLNQFKPFLRRADEHIEAQGGLATLARDVSAPEVARDAAPAGSAGPAAAAEPDHGAFWWWLHGLGFASTRHEQAELLRRALGVQGGEAFYRDGVRLDVDHMSDDDVLALDRALRDNPPAWLRPEVAAPIMTSWGWNSQQPYNKAKAELEQPGTHETLNGKVPTEEEAVRMIDEIGGRVVRNEDGHLPGFNSTHLKPHINYEFKDQNGQSVRATVYIRRAR